MLVGYSAQLSPLQSDSLWVEGVPSTKQEDKDGNTIYGQFNDVVVLKENNRLNATDPESMDFNETLERVRDRKIDKNKDKF